MKRRRRLALVSLGSALVAFSVLAACGDDDGATGLGGALDPAAASSVIDSTVEAFISGNDALGSLAALGPFIALITQQTDILALDLVPSPAEGAVARARELIRSGLARLTPPAAPGEQTAAGIPQALIGSTLIWDPGARTYVADPDDDGAAPDNGIRFRLYAPDPLTAIPVLPLADIGYADIVDASGLTGINVSLRAVVGAATLLDYAVNGRLGEAGFDLTSAGYLSDGQERLAFSLVVVGTPSSFEPSFTLNLGSLRVDFSFSGNDAGSGSTSVVITDLAGEDMLEFIFEFDAGGVITDESLVSINGETVATFVGTVDEAFLARAAGSPLSLNELQALGSLFNGIGVIFETFAELFFLGLALTGTGTLS